MILSGSAIIEAWEKGEIEIEDFDLTQVNPNSYNFRLGTELLHVADPDGIGPSPAAAIELEEAGTVLKPGNLYLGTTRELIGSSAYAMTLLGRSSMGRLGLFLNAAADLGHAGSRSRWTLELSVVQPLRLYPRMSVGQVAFWTQRDPIGNYRGRYHGDQVPVECRDPVLSGR